MKRIPSLDGLRALSISMVLVGHVTYSQAVPWRYIAPWAHYGVLAFFVISGFLITTLLLEEFSASGTISLRKFYIRRALRIFPLAYAFILCVFLLDRFHVVQVPGWSLVTAATYTSNYNPHAGWYFGHLWSLSVEEQFYFLWPSVILLAGIARSRRIAVGVILAVPILRAITVALFPQTATAMGGFFPLIADPIAIGCVAAFYKDELLARLAGSRFRIEIAALSFFSIYFPVHQPAVRIVFAILNQGVFSLGFAYTMMWLIANPGSSAARVLDTKPLVGVGILSYSLYLWQQLFVNQADPSFVGALGRLMMIFAVASLGHFVIERPFLKLKTRFSPKVIVQERRPDTRSRGLGEPLQALAKAGEEV